MLSVCVIGGWLYGFATSHIPSPHVISVFWIGNLCAPWLVLAFFAGRTQSSARWAVLAGILTDVACAVGFYASFYALLFSLDAARLGLHPAAPVSTVITTWLRTWVSFTFFWVLAAVAGGALYGLLGNWWRRRRSIVAGLAIALPFVVEPVLWPLKNRYYQGPWFIWAVEVAVGLAIAVWVIRSRKGYEQPSL